MLEKSLELIHLAESQAHQQANWPFLWQFFCFSQATTHSQEFFLCKSHIFTLVAMQAFVLKELQEVDQCRSGVPIQPKKLIAQHPCKGYPTTKAITQVSILKHQHLLHLRSA
jgi:hypothetical protein